MSPGWTLATILAKRALAPGLHQVTLEVSDPVAAAFRTPGQYHRVRTEPGAEAWFAVASAPGTNTFDYLVRAQGTVAAEWMARPVGGVVEVTPPEGPGFPVEQSRGKSLVLIGTGTGFAPLWSVLRSLLPRRSAFAQVHALYGAEALPHLAWADEFARFRAEGVHIEPVLEQPGPGWSGRTGRVQAHLSHLPVSDTVAFLCGHPGMISDVRALLEARGLPRQATFLNVPE